MVPVGAFGGDGCQADGAACDVATAYANAGVEEHVAASFTGHSPRAYRDHYVKPHRDTIEGENAVKRILDSGCGTE